MKKLDGVETLSDPFRHFLSESVIVEHAGAKGLRGLAEKKTRA